MAVTRDELHSFHEFAVEALTQGKAESLEILVQLWRETRLQQDADAAIQRGIDDVDAGRTRPFDEFWDEFSQKHKVADDE